MTRSSPVNSKILMGSSALFMGVLGVAATFLPREILSHYEVSPVGLPLLVVQTAGALYLGFAMINWMTRGSVVGGIYSRPVAFGNFLHFVMVAIVLLRGLSQWYTRPEFVVSTALYVLFACAFGLALFTRPAAIKSDGSSVSD